MANNDDVVVLIIIVKREEEKQLEEKMMTKAFSLIVMCARPSTISTMYYQSLTALYAKVRSSRANRSLESDCYHIIAHCRRPSGKHILTFHPKRAGTTPIQE